MERTKVQQPLQFLPLPPLPPLPSFTPFAPLPPLPPLPPLFPTAPILPTPPIQLDPEELINHVPSSNENYISSSTSSFSHTSSINGVETSGGGYEAFVNNNGVVNSESTRYGLNDNKK